MAANESPAKNTLDILVLEGDGIGPEITAATLDVLSGVDKAFGLGLSFSAASIGFASLKANGTTLTDAVVQRALSADGIILGPVSHNEYPAVAEGGINPSGALRKRLDLYANIRPARSRPVSLRAAASRSISSSCARTPKAFTPIATCISAPANICRRRIWLWRPAR